MIEDREVDGIACMDQLPRNPAIRIAGPGIAAWMIVSQHYGRAAEPSRV